MKAPLVLQSDFGLVDGAVAAMFGVSLDIDPNLQIYNLTHDIPPYHIWDASYRLYQSISYWPKNTVFVSVVDPGVGSERKSVVAKTADGKYITTPDNGTLTHVHAFIGLEEVREIEESKHRRKNTQHSYTFHGRDVYAVTGAKLASGKITFEEVGPVVPLEKIHSLELPQVTLHDGIIEGSIDILDIRFGSLWTNITREDFLSLGVEHGDTVLVKIYSGNRLAYHNRITYGRSFADVHVSDPVVYVNSLYRMAVAINQGNFAKAYNIGTGLDWTISFEKERE